MESQQFEYWLPPCKNEAYSYNPTVFYDFSTPDLVSIPSLSASPTSTTFDGTPAPPPPQHAALYHQNLASTHFGLVNGDANMSYQLPVTPSDFGSADDQSPYCSPKAPSSELMYTMQSENPGYPLRIAAEQAKAPAPVPVQTQAQHARSHSHPQYQAAAPERTHTTSGRRRAQNRAAQRAFRERKEKHAKDLEMQLASLSDKYGKLEASHAELGHAYEKLKKTIEVLTSEDADADDDVGDEVVLDGRVLRRDSLSLAARDPRTLGRLLEILHGEVRRGVKMEQ